MSREFFRTIFAKRGRKRAGRKKKLVGASYSRLCWIEPLEDRRLLSVSPPPIATINWKGRQVDVLQNQWLVGFTSVAAQSAILSDLSPAGSGSDASLTGLPTLSPTSLLQSNMSTDQVLAWAAARPAISYIQPNFAVHTTSIFPPNAAALANESNVDGLWGLNNTGQNKVEW